MVVSCCRTIFGAILVAIVIDGSGLASYRRTVLREIAIRINSWIRISCQLMLNHVQRNSGSYSLDIVEPDGGRVSIYNVHQETGITCSYKQRLGRDSYMLYFMDSSQLPAVDDR
jgi:hypothetical protein